MSYRMKSCVMCGSPRVTAVWDNHQRIAVVSCTACRRVVRIEFEPSDAPALRGTIELLFDPDEDFDA